MNQPTGTISSLRRRIAVGIVGAGAASLIFTGGVANAAPPQHRPGPAHMAPSQQAKVPGTSCNLGQVERALAKEDPALWKKISATPRRKQHFESMLVMTKEQRQAKRAQWMKNHPNMKQHHKMHRMTPAEKQKLKALRAKVIATCGQY